MKKPFRSVNALFRQKAEAFLKEKLSKSDPQFSNFEIQKLVHEIEVHQIELEMQNEELGQAIAAAQDAIDLYDFAPTGYFTLSKNGEILKLNLCAAKMLDKQRQHLINIRLELYISDETKPAFNLFFDKLFAGKCKESCEVILEANHNQPLSVQLTGIVKGKGENCLVTVVDITERKQAEEVLKKNENKYRKLHESMMDSVVAVDLQGRIMDFNQVFIEMLGYTKEEIINLSYVDLTPQQWHDSEAKIIAEQVLQRGYSDVYQKEYRKKDGTVFPIELRTLLIKDEAGNPSSMWAIIRDITERKLAEEEIKKSKEQLEQLYKHINEVREEERTSIAREIHDDLGQSLAGLKIDLIGIKENIGNTRTTKQKMTKAISLVSDTIKSVQKLASRLRPQMLDDLGLASAIEWQANEFKKRTGIKCKLELEEIEDLEGNIPISLFRIFQASLTNIMLHSKATTISVKLAMKDEILQLSVIDNGIGITPEQINSTKSFGLIGMRERANHINGKFEIHSEVNKGTEILVTVPVKRQ